MLRNRIGSLSASAFCMVMCVYLSPLSYPAVLGAPSEIDTICRVQRTRH